MWVVAGQAVSNGWTVFELALKNDSRDLTVAVEAELIPLEGIPLEVTRVSGLRGKGLPTLLLAPLKLMLAVFDAIMVVSRRRPKVVLGMGGFASGPGGFAAAADRVFERDRTRASRQKTFWGCMGAALVVTWWDSKACSLRI